MNFSDYNKKSNNILDNLSPEMRERLLQEATGNNININIGHNRENMNRVRTLGIDIRNATQNISEDEQKYLESNSEYMGLMTGFMNTLNAYIQNQYLESFLSTEQGSRIGENLLDVISNLRNQYTREKDKIIEEKIATKYQDQFDKLRKQVEAQNQVLNDPDVLAFIKDKNNKNKKSKDFGNKVE